jgi:uncharacterized membrane protein YqgA involved in biofilm formation
MTGTVLNVASVLVGGSLGLAFGNRLPERVRGTVTAALGLFTLAIGVRLFLQSEEPIIAIGSLALGGLLGEWSQLEDKLKSLGARLEARFARGGAIEGSGGRFVRGFLTATLLFEVGPMTILGSIQDGLTGDYSLLAIKSTLDGFAALALASAFGLGVVFSTVGVLLYQGGLTLAAAQAQAVLTDAMMAEMTAVGGVLLVGIAVGSLLELRPIRTGNLLPALAVAPFLVWIISRFAG